MGADGAAVPSSLTVRNIRRHPWHIRDFVVQELQGFASNRSNIESSKLPRQAESTSFQGDAVAIHAMPTVVGQSQRISHLSFIWCSAFVLQFRPGAQTVEKSRVLMTCWLRLGRFYSALT